MWKYFYVPLCQVETRYSLVLQLMIFVSLHTSPSVQIRLIFISKGIVEFSQIALIKFTSVHFRLTFKFRNQTIDHFSEIFVEFNLANLGCNYGLN